MRKKTLFVLTLISIIVGTYSYASPSTSDGHWSDWQSAKSLYDSQKFEEALAEFQAHPKNDASYFYNVGTTYFRLKRLGEARAYMEKANRLKPHDPDIQFNLNTIRAQVSRSIGEEKLDPSSTWAERLADRISLDEIRTTLGMVGLIVALFWIRGYLKTRKLRKVIITPAGFISLAGLLITSGIYGIQRWSDANPPAICLHKEIIRSGPGDHYLELARIDEGSKIRLLGSALSSESLSSSHPDSGELRTQWKQIRYSPNGIGWIKASSLLAL